MHRKLCSIILTVLFLLSGCAASAGRTASPREAEYQRLNAMGAVPVNEIILLSVKSPVRIGDTGGLKIQGRAGARYTVTAVYRHSGRLLTTTVGRSAGPDGVASWSWDVGAGTEPGTYRLLIRGDGKSLTTAYTVVAG